MRRDRETILARRALFVASALSGAMSSRAIAAEPEPTCAPPTSPSAEQLATARELFLSGTKLGQMGAHEEALEHLERAYALVPNPTLLVMIAETAGASGDWARAFTRAELALGCKEVRGNWRARAIEIVDQASARIARLIIETRPDGAELELGEQPIGKAPLGKPVIVNPGQHRLTARWPSGGTTSAEIVVAGAENRIIVLDEPPSDECLLEPCVCLQPCLSLPTKQRRPRFGAALGYTSFIDVTADEHSNTGHGLGARAYYELPFGERASFEIGLAVTPALIPGGSLIPIGGSFALLLRTEPLLVGPMLSAGYVLADDAAARSSIFVHPELVLGLPVSEKVLIGAHLGPFLSLRAKDDDRSFGVGWLGAGVFLSYAFGPACTEEGRPRTCEEPSDQVASY
jgi:hypothetical protein